MSEMVCKKIARMGAWLTVWGVTLSGCGTHMFSSVPPPRLTRPQQPPQTHQQIQQLPHSKSELLELGRKSGLPLTDPLELDAPTRAALDKNIWRSVSPEERLAQLVDFLMEGGGRSRFEYSAADSLSAQDAYDQRRADCIGYTNLFIAASRHLGLQTYFVRVRESPSYFERAGTHFASWHIAAGYGESPSSIVIDFAKRISDWRLSRYEKINDTEALALYYNNRAVELLLKGHSRPAEAMFLFWLKHTPEVAEIYNNYAVLLNRGHRYVEALQVLDDGIRRFPTHESLFTNAIWAARGAQRPDLVQRLEQHAKHLKRSDPYFLFTLALAHFESDRYDLAAQELEQAWAVNPDSPVILAWLARAYLSSGQHEQALSAFQRIKALQAPDGDRLLRELEAQHPELSETGR